MSDKMRIEVAPNQEVTALVYIAGKPDLADATLIEAKRRSLELVDLERRISALEASAKAEGGS
jgi:hypothetical protein